VVLYVPSCVTKFSTMDVQGRCQRPSGRPSLQRRPAQRRSLHCGHRRRHGVQRVCWHWCLLLTCLQSYLGHRHDASHRTKCQACDNEVCPSLFFRPAAKPGQGSHSRAGTACRKQGQHRQERRLGTTPQQRRQRRQRSKGLRWTTGPMLAIAAGWRRRQHRRVSQRRQQTHGNGQPARNSHASNRQRSSHGAWRCTVWS
jgi:hypothetical protein